MTKEQKTEILIAGGGVVGASLALVSARLGFDTLLVDASEKTAGREGDPRASMLSSPSRDLLERTGVLDGRESLLQPVRQMVISHGPRDRGPQAESNQYSGVSPFFLTFAEEGKTSSDGRQAPIAWTVENRHLHTGQEQAMQRMALPRLNGVRVLTCERTAQNRIGAQLDNGTQIVARFCIAADGADSHLREDSGIETTGWRYESQALTAVVAHEWEHEGIAQEHFFPSGPFAILPLPGRRSSLVWTDSPEVVQALTRCREEMFLSEARRCMGGHPGHLSLEGQRLSYPIRLQLARNYGAEGLLLAGDAAHVVHPLAGQGLNMGLKDVIALEELLQENRRLGLAIDSSILLRRYQSRRRFDNLAMGMITDGTHRLFQGDSAVLRLLRDICLGTAQASPWIRSVGKRLTGAEEPGVYFRA